MYPKCWNVSIHLKKNKRIKGLSLNITIHENHKSYHKLKEIYKLRKSHMEHKGMFLKVQ